MYTDHGAITVEAQGCGTQVLMSAKTAIEMGATIYGSESILCLPLSYRIGANDPSTIQSHCIHCDCD